MNQNYKHADITGKIIKAFYNVYNVLGYGFLEKVYENAMLLELQSMGLNCSNQLPIDVFYKDAIVGKFYADILVENVVIVEIKAIQALAPEHEVVLVNYLKGTGIEVGLLLNFGPVPQHKRRVLTKEYLDSLRG